MEIRQVTLTGVTAAVICVLGPLVLPLPFGPVPVSGFVLWTALTLGVLPFIPGDLCKIIVSIVISRQIRRRLYLK